jgi:hypothetical protein
MTQVHENHVLAEVHTTVPEDDLPAVLAAASGRNPDGTAAGAVRPFQPADNQGDRT